mmetsp:Transcript_5472/g.9535  ORF Transcript_5472/g.9535 Transcript_5472/m.9535 type:complete len:193 (-) Transcript_5472:13-591(-)
MPPGFLHAVLLMTALTVSSATVSYMSCAQGVIETSPSSNVSDACGFEWVYPTYISTVLGTGEVGTYNCPTSEFDGCLSLSYSYTYLWGDEFDGCEVQVQEASCRPRDTLFYPTFSINHYRSCDAIKQFEEKVMSRGNITMRNWTCNACSSRDCNADAIDFPESEPESVSNANALRAYLFAMLAAGAELWNQL